MDPCVFVRVSVSALGLRLPVASKPAGAGVHPASSPCHCEIRLTNFPLQTAPLPLFLPTSTSEPDSQAVAASFYLDEVLLRKLRSNSCLRSSKPCLQVIVYTGRQGSCCGVRTGKKLGKFTLPVATECAAWKPAQIHSGWVSIGNPKANGKGPAAELHLNVKVELDPRYMFQFDGEPEASPQIMQIHGNIRQPIFSCKFTRDRSRLGPFETTSSGHGWAGSLHGDKEKERKERKGWLIILHDLSGSPVAAASMITPFVPTAGSDRVSRSNPGCWLILRPGPVGKDSWRPWGRLEAWRDRGSKGGVRCRFQLIAEGGGVAGVNSGVLVSETVISARKGGKFLIDTPKFKPEICVPASPVESPHSSGEFYFSLGVPVVGGFVMSADVQGEGKCSKPQVQIAMRHVTCIEDAAVFMALAAAVDLSMDACVPFTRKLGKRFCG